MDTRNSLSLPQVADLYADIPDGRTSQWRHFAPGLCVVAIVTLAAAFLAERYNAPISLMSLLLGLAVNFLNTDTRLQLGFAFTTGPLLRLAIVLLGAQITLEQIAAFGWPALLALALIVSLTIASAHLASRAFGLDARFGMLAGGAVAICGASAAVAIAAVLGKGRENQAQLALVLVGISAMSSFALLFYSAVAQSLHMSSLQAGFVMGASIHDVAQSVSAGYSYSKEAGEVATIFKIGRVAMLGPVLLLVAWIFARSEKHSAITTRFPWFIIGFLVLVLANSVGFVPTSVGGFAHLGAIALVSGAVAAAGIQAPLQTLRELGWRPFIVIAAATLAAFSLSLTSALTGVLPA